MRGVAGALWLAKREIRGAWLSYPLSAMLTLFVGLLAVASLSGVFEIEGFGAVGQRMEEYCNALFSDYLFLVVCALLGVNAFSREQGQLLWRDGAAVEKLHFLRRLPVSAQSVVGGRLISMLFALLLNALTFFVAAYVFTDLGELGASYVWFAGIWIGYSLFATGLCLLVELTANSKARVLLSFGFATSLMVTVALLEWTLEPTLVERTAQMARSFGALLAIPSILAGGAGLALLVRLAAWRLENRDLFRNLSP